MAAGALGRYKWHWVKSVCSRSYCSGVLEMDLKQKSPDIPSKAISCLPAQMELITFWTVFDLAAFTVDCDVSRTMIQLLTCGLVTCALNWGIRILIHREVTACG